MAITSVSNLILGFILGALTFLLVAMLTYLYGKFRGSSEKLKDPTVAYPNLPDITIVGKYRVPIQTTEELANRLRDWMISNAFRYQAFPNVLKMRSVYETAEMLKKKSFFDKLKLFRDGFPEELTMLLYPSPLKNTIIVDVICTPYMYRKMAQNVQFLFPKTSIDDAKTLCTQFIKDTMHILGADTIVEPKAKAEICPVENFEFLYNTPTESAINKKAHELIQIASKQILLAGWVDREFIGELENAKGRGLDVRLITKSTEGSNKLVREDFNRLKVLGKQNIKLNKRFHDRFLVCDNNCIIGSMYYTDASKTRYESVVLTDNIAVIEKLKEHFERIWKDRESISPNI
jgi:hypothetical protein